MLIAIAGEDAKFCAQLQPMLAQQGHEVLLIPASAPLSDTLRASGAQLLVLVPSGSDGKGVLSAIRADGGLKLLPILCVDPRGSSRDAVAWLDAGADDFVNRPFDPAIFQARVRTLLRRRVWSGEIVEEGPTLLSRGALSLKLVARQAFLDGKPLPLTRLEFDLLAHLLKAPVGKPATRQDLLSGVWNYPQDVETRTLDKHVETLRRKLGAFGGLIETVHGVGYRLAEPPAVSQSRR